MTKKPTKAQFERMLAEIEMHPGTEHEARTRGLIGRMLNTKPAPFTPKAKKKRGAKK